MIGDNMRAQIRDRRLLWLRVTAASAAPLLPPGLELVTRGPWTFWCVEASRVEQFRPEGVPPWSGVSFDRVVYALLAQAMTDTHDVQRGLYVVRTDTDRGIADLLARQVPTWRPHPADIASQTTGGGMRYEVAGTEHAEGDAIIQTIEGSFARPSDSCFASALDAGEFFRLPEMALAAGEDDAAMLRVTCLRHAVSDTHRPMQPLELKLGFLAALGHGGAVAEWAVSPEDGEGIWAARNPQRLMPGRLQHAHLLRRDPSAASNPAPAEAA